MNEEEKQRFLAAVTGESGKVAGRAAAVLIAAAASGGDPHVAEKIVARMTAPAGGGGLGDQIDPAMMAALMACTAMVAQGASNEEVMQQHPPSTPFICRHPLTPRGAASTA